MDTASPARCTSCAGTGRSPSPSAGPRPWTRSSGPSTGAAVPDLHGKVALITGVGRVGQIGHAVAKGFAEAGAKLVLADVNAVGLADRVREFKAGGHRVASSAGDLTTPPAPPAPGAGARQQVGGLGVVVNVAGGLVNYGSALGLAPEQLAQELPGQAETTIYGSQA